MEKQEQKTLTTEICKKYKDGYGLCDGECYFKSSALKVCYTESTAFIFAAYKNGTFIHRQSLEKAFPDYFIDAWKV